MNQNTADTKKLILIDGHALVHRAFHALPPTMSSPRGIPTNAVYGFTSVLLKMLKDLKPDYIVATFDLAGPTFRHDEFADYKATRSKAPDELHAQVPLVKEMLTAFGIPIFEKEGYEADDVIGSLARLAKAKPNIQVIIMTGDMDTLQLVQDDKVVVLTLRKGVSDTIIYDEDKVRARFGLTPEQMKDYKGLKGDPSDNIPGVPGIGDKTASTLLKEFGTLEKLYAALEANKVRSISEKLREKLLANKDMAFFSKRLATIVCDLDIPFSLKEADWKNRGNQTTIEKLMRDLGIYSLAKRLPEAFGIENSTTAPSLFEPSAIEVKELKYIKDMPKADRWAVAEVDNKLVVSNSEDAVYQLNKDSLADLSGTIIGHGLKPLLKNSESNQLLFDTEIGAYLLQPDQRDYDLYKIYYALTSKAANEKPIYRPVYIWKLAQILEDRIKKLKLDKVFYGIEMPLIRVLARMEMRGILINTSSLGKLLKTTNAALKKLETKIYRLAGSEFNINSPAQLSEIIFNKLGLKGRIRHTGGGALSTAAAELEKLRDLHPIIGLVLEYRELQKLKTTYIEPFPSLVGPDNRLHTTYNQAGAATGRLSSQDPNLQNIPTRTELGQEFRKAFIAEKGFSLVAFDYSQLELRLVAHLAQDATMIETFKRGQDIHTRTAAEIYAVPPEKVTKEMRRQAKVLNFGIIYGMGPLGFSRASGVNRDQAKKFIDAYFTEFKGVAAYMEQMKKFAARTGYVETLFGRKRPLPDIHSGIPQLKAQAERIAINHPAQGTEADLIKLAMIAIDEHLRKEGLDQDVRMLLQVHDELVFEIKAPLIKKISPKIKELMEQVHKFDVPITVDVKFGPNWSDMERLDV